MELGATIKCYECHSEIDPRCEQEILPQFFIDCSLKQDRDDWGRTINYTSCRKITQTIAIPVNQRKLI